MTTDFDLSTADPLDLVTLAAAIVDHRDNSRNGILVRYACLAVLEPRPHGSLPIVLADVLAVGRARLGSGASGTDLNRATKAANQIYLHVWGSGGGGVSPSSPAPDEGSSTVAG